MSRTPPGDLARLSRENLDAAAFLELTDPPLMGENTEDDASSLRLAAFILGEMERRMRIEGRLG